MTGRKYTNSNIGIIRKLDSVFSDKHKQLSYISDLHNHFSNELRREDEKSERLFTLIIALLTAFIFASVYLYISPDVNQSGKEILLYSILGNMIFLFCSLIVSGTSLFDLVYYKEFVFTPFKPIVHFIGVYLLGTKISDLKLYMQLHSKKDFLFLLVSEAGANEKNYTFHLSNFYQKDNEWKQYLVSVKCKARRWAIIFFALGLLEMVFSILLNLIFNPFGSLLFSILIITLFVFYLIIKTMPN